MVVQPQPKFNPQYLLSMARTMQTVLSFCLDTIIITILFTLVPNPRFVHSTTLESNVWVLRSIKQSIDPVSITSNSFLSTWNFNIDPCDSPGNHFLGILCTQDSSSSQISAIDLEGDGLEGFLTPAIGNLTALATLNLSKNRFRGPIPAAFTNLRKLTSLVLSDNFISGSIPYRINRLKKLENIDLSRNRLTGSIPGTVSGLRSLSSLSLSYNEFTGRIPSLSGLWQLKTLDLSNNQLYGNLPELPQKLRSLSLGHNLLSGHISFITRLQNLKRLDLSDNRFTDSINPGIFRLPVLNHLNVSMNRFTAIEIEPSDGSTQLEVLDLHGNRLRDRLPVTLVTYKSLTTLYLGNNLFSGQIPKEYGNSLGKPWRKLFLDHNFLSGSLPPQFNSGTVRIRGSLVHNCLSCPHSVQLCHGGQRPASECVEAEWQ